VTCGSTASDGGGAFIGSADDLDRNLEQFIMVLHNDVSDEDAEEFERVYKANVKDWRSY
jgi:polyphosphate kinase